MDVNLNTFCCFSISSNKEKSMPGKSTCNWCSSTLMDPKNNTIHVIYFVLLSSNSKKAVEYKATKKQTQARSLQSWQKRFILVQITFNWSYSIGVIHGTAIVHSDCYSLCATGLHVRSLAFCYVYQWSTLTCQYSGWNICWWHHSSGAFRFCWCRGSCEHSLLRSR